MQQTTNYNLKKPGMTDTVGDSIPAYADNLDDIDTLIKGLDDDKVDKISGKGLSTNDYTTDEKNKLAGIEAGAEVNNISDADANELTGGGETDLHKHAADKITYTGNVPEATSVQEGLDRLHTRVEEIITTDFPATNIIKNGNFENGTTGWTPTLGSGLVTDGVYEYTTITLSSTSGLYQEGTLPVSGHIYYVFGDIKPIYNNLTRFKFGGVEKSVTGQIKNVGEWNRVSCNIKPTSDTGGFRFMHSVSTNYVVGDKIYFKHIGAIDLTQTFGVGKEPSKEKMDSILSNYPNGWFGGTVSPLIKQKDLFNELQDLINSWSEFMISENESWGV